MPAALDYGISAVRLGENDVPPLPAALVSQAHAAARSGIGLSTVLRRYFAGYAVLGDFLTNEIQQSGDLPAPASRRLARGLTVVFDGLLTRISEEYDSAVKAQEISSNARLAKRIRQLLAGELVDTSDLNYDFEASHIGVVATGSIAITVIHRLAKATDNRVLMVRPTSDLTWAWLSRRGPSGSHHLVQHLPPDYSSSITMGIGECAPGFSGWRLTHNQAVAAWSVAARSSRAIAQYGDVALLASMLQDHTLTESLSLLYLDPLRRGQDGGAALRATLRAYFTSGRNAASAAAALGVSRQTIANRLRAIEKHIGRPIAGCVSGLEAAMLLADVYEAPNYGTTRARAPGSIGRD